MHLPDSFAFLRCDDEHILLSSVLLWMEINHNYYCDSAAIVGGEKCDPLILLCAVPLHQKGKK
jgi:hypothetical protein